MHDSPEHWLHTVLDTLEEPPDPAARRRHRRDTRCWWAVLVGVCLGLIWLCATAFALDWLRVTLIAVTGIIVGRSLYAVWQLRAVSWADRRKRTIL